MLDRLYIMTTLLYKNFFEFTGSKHSTKKDRNDSEGGIFWQASDHELKGIIIFL